jgi:hypothetical protein
MKLRAVIGATTDSRLGSVPKPMVRKSPTASDLLVRSGRGGIRIVLVSQWIFMFGPHVSRHLSPLLKSVMAPVLAVP